MGDDQDIARAKHFLLCLWMGLLYGTCLAVISNVRWSIFLLVVVIVGVSAYLGVGRTWLERVAPAVLLVTLLGLAGMFPAPEDWRAFAHSVAGRLRLG